MFLPFILETIDQNMQEEYDLFDSRALMLNNASNNLNKEGKNMMEYFSIPYGYILNIEVKIEINSKVAVTWKNALNNNLTISILEIQTKD